MRETFGSVTAPEQLRAALLQFGLRQVAARDDEDEHCALTRHVRADAEHIPAEAMRRWQEVGPGRTMTEMASQLARVSRLGILEAGEPGLAASHLAALVSSAQDDTVLAVDDLSPSLTADERQRALVEAAIDAFLHGHADGCHEG